ncbi:hypothetical protein AVEN_224402-1 [Araneus ventricosus]|uniref:Uncharacterized protein n=1 Tax=Araneus ventricosus TaxID=182803 RepID=A0A4Y2FHD8_ARAVE|nr:hypothetical protein AVEN_224402-1 [Araneus ventricosus]
MVKFEWGFLEGTVKCFIIHTSYNNPFDIYPTKILSCTFDILPRGMEYTLKNARLMGYLAVSFSKAFTWPKITPGLTRTFRTNKMFFSNTTLCPSATCKQNSGLLRISFIFTSTKSTNNLS